MDKKTLRKLKSIERDSLGQDKLRALSDMISDRVMALDEFAASSIILSFASFKSEVSTYRLMEEALKMGKKIYVPKVIGKDMIFYRIKSMEELEPGYYGVPEPVNLCEENMLYLHKGTDAEENCSDNRKCERSEDTDPPAEDDLNHQREIFVIVPGLAFDRKLNRIGYGAGFYDRFFRKYGNTTFFKCAVAFDMQLCDEIDADEFDVKCDLLITEKETIYKKS